MKARTLKRTFDIAVSASCIVLGIPLFAAIAIAVILDSPGPVFYPHERVGRSGIPFSMLKFRSMVVGADKGSLRVPYKDPRVTRVGRFLRRTSLDELPQLWNVLKGDMSLVGPRPTVDGQVRKYDAYQRRRLEVLPGITGWAQVNGRAALAWPERIGYDIWYIDNWSFALDLLIIWRTIMIVLSKKGVYAEERDEREGPTFPT